MKSADNTFDKHRHRAWHRLIEGGLIQGFNVKR
jgi:hypothetical protein